MDKAVVMGLGDRLLIVLLQLSSPKESGVKEEIALESAGYVVGGEKSPSI